MQFFYFLIFILGVSLTLGCSPNVKDNLQLYQTIYKNVPCIQCQPFEVASALNFNCSTYAESFEDGNCGIFSPAYTLSAKHCAVATITCFPVGVGHMAAWGISAGPASEAADAEITLISQSNNLLVDLPLHCNNETTWNTGKLVGEETFLTTKAPSDVEAADTPVDFVLPSFFASGNFTLHCISSKPSNDSNIDNVNQTNSSATTVTLSIPETDEETTSISTPLQTTSTSAGTTNTPPIVVVDNNSVNEDVSTTTDAVVQSTVAGASSDNVTQEGGNSV